MQGLLLLKSERRAMARFSTMLGEFMSGKRRSVEALGKGLAMKTYELVRAVEKMGKWLNATETESMVEAINELAGCSATKRKKDRLALVARRERFSRPSVHYAGVIKWVECDEEGNPLTECGRKMRGEFDILGYK